MKNVKKAAPQYDTPSPWLLQFAKQSVGLRLSTAEDRRPLSRKKRLKELREDREYNRKVQHEWKSSSEYKHLALQLGVGGVFAAPSGDGLQGEYINGTLPRDWILSEGRRALMNGITEDKVLPIILVDIEKATCNDGASQTIAHEIGHHLDYLANGSYRTRQPRRNFLSTFHRAGFYTCGDSAGSQSELIAETLGRYLCGTKLPSVLLTEVNRVLARLSRKHVTIVRKFRRSQIARKMVAQQHKRKIAA